MPKQTSLVQYIYKIPLLKSNYMAIKSINEQFFFYLDFDNYLFFFSDILRHCESCYYCNYFIIQSMIINNEFYCVTSVLLLSYILLD